ncbi:MAG: hypothetical protein GX557_04065 [Chloroflexi bacterium]|nr:hypothetical protein [Chloroflexota bacterium]
MQIRNETDWEAASDDASIEQMEWMARFSLWRNKVVMRQLGLVFIVPLLVLALVATAAQWPPTGENLGVVSRVVGITAAVFGLLLLLAVALTDLGGYAMAYRMDARGISGRPHGRTAKRNAAINTLLVLSGRPSAMGAGMLAQSRQQEYAAWKDVDRAEGDPSQRTVTLYKGRRALMVVACDEAHYDTVLAQAVSATARRNTRTSG